jgi:hypothetical protein
MQATEVKWRTGDGDHPMTRAKVEVEKRKSHRAVSIEEAEADAKAVQRIHRLQQQRQWEL